MSDIVEFNVAVHDIEFNSNLRRESSLAPTTNINIYVGLKVPFTGKRLLQSFFLYDTYRSDTAVTGDVFCGKGTPCCVPRKFDVASTVSHIFKIFE